VHVHVHVHVVHVHVHVVHVHRLSAAWSPHGHWPSLRANPKPRHSFQARPRGWEIGAPPTPLRLPSHAPLMNEIAELKQLGRSRQMVAGGTQLAQLQQRTGASLHPAPCALQPTAEGDENDENVPPGGAAAQQQYAEGGRRVKQRRKPSKGLAHGGQATAGGARGGPHGIPAALALADRTNRQGGARIAVRI
jgi:hypothetical protein